VKFLVDNQLPSALARFLDSRGSDCCHVLDVGLADASDAEIWAYAARTERILISKDEDFLYLAHAADAKVRFVWIRIGNCRKKVLLAVPRASPAPHRTAAICHSQTAPQAAVRGKP